MINYRWKVEYRIDTRDKDGDNKPIPGTGEIHRCNCCNKEHEIIVELFEIDMDNKRSKTGNSLIVGTSCAKKLKVIDCQYLSNAYTVSKGNGNLYKRIMSRINQKGE